MDSNTIKKIGNVEDFPVISWKSKSIPGDDVTVRRWKINWFDGTVSFEHRISSSPGSLSINVSKVGVISYASEDLCLEAESSLNKDFFEKKVS